MGGVEVEHHTFLISSLVGGEWLPLTQKKVLRYPLNRRGVEWAPDPVWKFWRRDKFLYRTGVRTPPHPACSVVAIPTTLFRITKIK